MLDGAGLIESASYDFQGHPLTTSRKLAATFTDEPDWTPAAGSGTPSALLAQAAPLLETETFSKAFAYDALGRITSATQPDLSELRPTYDDGGLLEAIDAKIRGAATWTPFVVGITYDAKGRRERIDYGNGTFTEYTYDPLSFRLTRLRTLRPSGGSGSGGSGGTTVVLQDLFYFYDPVGNITTIRDGAHEDVFFAGQQVSPTVPGDGGTCQQWYRHHEGCRYEVVQYRREIVASRRSPLILMSARIGTQNQWWSDVRKQIGEISWTPTAMRGVA